MVMSPGPLGPIAEQLGVVIGQALNPSASFTAKGFAIGAAEDAMNQLATASGPIVGPLLHSVTPALPATTPGDCGPAAGKLLSMSAGVAIGAKMAGGAGATGGATAAMAAAEGAEIAAAEGGTVELFHGTTQAGAGSIMSEGLLPVSRNTAPLPAGSFFTHAGEGGQVGASHWAASRATSLPGGAPTVLRGTMPQATFDSLSSQGLIRTGPVPGLPYFPQQTVILPGGLPAASGQIQWTVVPLTF
jgi:hypothetical protein